MSSRSRPKKKARVAAAAPTLSKEKQQEIENAFKVFDAKQTGSISVKQVNHAMQSLGLVVKKDEIRTWVAVGPDGSSGTVDLATFTRMAESKLEQQAKSLRAFKLFDKDGKGVICFEDLQRVAQELGETLTNDELEEMIQEADRSGEGVFVNREDFMELARNVNL